MARPLPLPRTAGCHGLANEPVRRGLPAPRGRAGFTLIELGVVVVIIGILISLVLVASYEGLQRAQERQTQATIIKIDQGLTERLDALLSQVPPPNGAHQFLAATFSPASPTGTPSYIWGLQSDARAAVIARLDYLKAEMPDVFIVDTTTDPEYPLNFAGLPYPVGASGRAAYLLPLGHLVPGYRPDSDDSMGNPVNVGPGANYIVNPSVPPNQYEFVNGTDASTSTGIYGASYSARGAFHKILGLPSQAYDGVDNDRPGNPGYGWIDDLTPGETGWTQAQIDGVLARLANHTHKTARSECLYALLVGGVGPLGSVFSPDDFGPNEIGDTDQDGLPEFLDAWGEPLQFYRWPVHHTSGLQRGAAPYLTVSEPRETSSNDPNNLLLAPSWWAASFNRGSPAISGGDPFVATGPLYPYGGSNTGNPPPPIGPPIDAMSGHAAAVMYFFGSIAEPLPLASGQTSASLWDRSGFSMRRAYFTRPLIISSGPDKLLGIARLARTSRAGVEGLDAYGTAGYAVIEPTPALLTMVENTASPFNPSRNNNPPYFSPTGPIDPSLPIDVLPLAAQDDISNQNLQAPSGGIR